MEEKYLNLYVRTTKLLQNLLPLCPNHHELSRLEPLQVITFKQSNTKNKLLFVSPLCCKTKYCSVTTETTQYSKTQDFTNLQC